MLLNSPPITVVVSTNSRGNRIAAAIQTILQNNYSDFELRVTDQSRDDLAEASILSFRSDRRLCYSRAKTTGLSTGRNAAIAASKNEIIAITDDDCRTPPNWLRELANAFAVDPRIGMVFGNTHVGPHDPSKGFIPSYIRKEPFLARGIHEKHLVEGIGACAGLKKSVWKALGGFDECLGPGALFRAGDDADFAIRTLLAGFYVFETPAFKVDHYGFRTWQEGRNLIHGYLYGLGAAYAKHLKCRHWPAILLLARLAARWAFLHPAVGYGHLPPRGLRLRGFLQGFSRGLFHPVDRVTSRYISRPGFGSR